MSRFALLLGLLASTGALQAQPRIHPNGAVNAASFLPPTAPGGAIAQGSIFSVFGEGLGSRGLEAREFPLPVTLGGVRVFVATAEGDSFEAPLLYVGESQVNAILPSGVPAGRHRLRIVRDGQASDDLFIKVVESSVGIFEGHGFSYGRPRPAGANFREPLHPGEAAILWATGLGPSPGGDFEPAPAADLPANVKVFVAGLQADVFYLGRAACCAGLDQINYVVPEQAPPGCFVPVWAEVAGDLVSNVVTINVARSGGECEDEHDGLIEQFMSGVAEIELQRTFVQDAVIDTPRATVLHRQEISALAPYLPLRFDDIARTPPAGSCLIHREPTYLNPFALAPVDPIVLAGPIGEGRLALRADLDPGATSAPYTGGSPTHEAAAESSLLLEPGFYTAESAEFRTFPSFTGDLDTGAPAVWTNREAVPPLARESGLTLRFESGGRERRKILASTSPGFIYCHVSSVDGELHIPRAFLANLEAERIELTFSDAVYEPLEFPVDSWDTGWLVHRRDEKIDLDLGPIHLPSTPVTLPNGQKIQAELAATAAERARGLMFRPVLDADKGMLFLFESSSIQRFWMLNTLVPLDILWMNEKREIQFISADTPPCRTQACPTYGPDEASRYVLELAAGETRRRGLSAGDVLKW